MIDEILQSLGLGEYESKVYLAFLGQEPISAYEAAKRSGVPSSKIYQVIERLVEKQAVIRFEENNKTIYTAQTPKDFLAQQKEAFTQKLVAAESALETLSAAAPVSYVWNIRREDELLNRARLLIRDARTELLVSAYAEEMLLLRPDLEAALKRGVQLAVVHFGQPQFRLGRQFFHPIEDTLAAERGGRMITVVADQSLALTGTLSHRGQATGSWSRDPSFVLLAEDYIKHDIYLTKIVERFDAELTGHFGQGYAKLREIFSDEEAERNES